MGCYHNPLNRSITHHTCLTGLRCLGAIGLPACRRLTCAAPGAGSKRSKQRYRSMVLKGIRDSFHSTEPLRIVSQTFQQGAIKLANGQSRLESNTLSGRVVQYIVEYIRERELQSGDKMPSEIQISADLKISCGIVREAFRSLNAAGILEVGAGRSPKVGALNNVLLTHVMRHALSTRQVSPERVLDLRCSIEVRAAELAAEMCTERNVTDLRVAVCRNEARSEKSGSLGAILYPVSQNHQWRRRQPPVPITGRNAAGMLGDFDSRRTGKPHESGPTYSHGRDSLRNCRCDRIATGYPRRLRHENSFDEAKDALRGVADAARREMVSQSVSIPPGFLLGQNI
jgi:DNA-binding transcriptional regulator YhcF (GntR family)